MNQMNRLKTLLLLSLPVLLSACALPLTSKSDANYFYLNPDKDISRLGRVAIVELDNDSPYPQIAAEITKPIFKALQKKQLFGLTVVRQDDPTWRSLQLDSNSTYTLVQLLAIRRTLNCDAVLIGTVTEYQPYPHMAIGLRLRLIDLKDGQLIWALEQIWDSADKTTAYRIKKYFKTQTRPGSRLLSEKLITRSSLKFIKFVAFEVAETL